MRCKECNVDLGEEYTVCPLCQSKAVDDEKIIKDVLTAEYPKYQNKEPEKFVSDYPQKYILRIIFAVCVVLGIVSLFTKAALWSLSVPMIMAMTAIMCFVFGINEKSKMCHNGVMLLTCIVVNLIFLIVSLIAKTQLMGIIISNVIAIFLFLVLFIIKPKKMVAQMKALFSL